MDAADAPRPLLSRYLREAAIDFCEKSESYTYDVEGLDTYMGEPEYEFDTPHNTQVVKIWSLKLEDRLLKPSSIVLLNSEVPNWRTDTGTPSFYFFAKRHLTLAPIPNTSTVDGITGVVALKPTRNAAVLDEDFYDENSQAILDGARMRLFRDASKPWGDIMLSGVHQQLFMMAIEDAKSKIQQDHTAKRVTTTYGGL